MVADPAGALHGRGKAGLTQEEIESLPIEKKPVAPAVEGTVQSEAIVGGFLGARPLIRMIVSVPHPVEIGSRQPQHTVVRQRLPAMLEKA